MMTTMTTHRPSLFRVNYSYADLEKLPAPQDGLSLAEHVESLKTAMLRRKWTIYTEPEISITRDCQECTASFECDITQGRDLDPGWRYAMGMICSMRGHKGTRLYHGVFAPGEPCGIVMGSIRAGKRGNNHGKYPVTPRLDKALDHIVKTNDKNMMICRLFRDYRPQQLEWRAILHEAGQLKLMPWSRIGLVTEKMANRDDPSYWDLLMDFIHTGWVNPPMKQMEQNDLFREILERTCGLWDSPLA